MKAPEGHFVLVEVKSSGAAERGLLSRGQKRRLQRAQLYWGFNFGFTELLILVEDGRGFLEVPVQE